MLPQYQTVLEKITAIETEMKKSGYWQENPLSPEAYNFSQAFAMDTMTFAQWLQFIFIPRVHEIIDQKGNFPSGSQVASQAAREFDGDPKANQLTQLLIEFDALFNS